MKYGFAIELVVESDGSLEALMTAQQVIVHTQGAFVKVLEMKINNGPIDLFPVEPSDREIEDKSEESNES